MGDVGNKQRKNFLSLSKLECGPPEINSTEICLRPTFLANWNKRPGGGGGTHRKIWVGVCGPLPKTLTLFMTKICDFPYPIYDLQSSRWRGRQSADGRRGT